MAPTVLVMLKAPQAGAVKTRLAASVGPERALETYTRLAELQLAAIPADWPVAVHFAPADAGDQMRRWLGPGVRLVAQTGGDLGARLGAATEAELARNPSGVLAIGGDCPDLGGAVLARAARQLEESDVVLGPTLDGGYYLIGIKAARPRLFQGIAWSTPSVLGQTIGKAREEACTLALLPVLEDVDDGPSLERMEARARA